MKKINIDLLKKGDVVLTTSSKKNPSGVIRTVTKSDVSHAMICVAGSSVIDSTGDGVHARNIQKIFYDDSCAIYILRPKEPLTEEVINKIVNYARASTGTRYSLLEAVKSVMPKLNKIGGGRQFCSRMVARAYAHGGLKLVDNPDYCTPEDIKKSEFLMQINPADLPASDEEMEEIKEIGDATEEMRKVTNNLLDKLRKLNNSVESVSDINFLVIEKPELDDEVSKALKESGYIDFWKLEIERFPWRYDVTLLTQLYHHVDDKEIIIDYCRKTISIHENGEFDHWESNCSDYGYLSKSYEYNVFQLLLDMYIKLSFYHSERVKAAKILLSVYAND